jgi:molybdopterin converting factor small subunit
MNEFGFDWEPQMADDVAGLMEAYQPFPDTRPALQNLVDQALKHQYPAVHRCICDETGAVRRHINLFVNQSLWYRQTGLNQKLAPGDVLFIMTAVSGG